MSASTQDLIVGLDPTGYTTITGAQLAQLVNSATPETDKGLIIVTTDSSGVPDVPDATTTTKWQKYLWLRISPLTTSFTLCAWNPNQLYNMGYSNGSGLTVSTYWNPVSSGSIPAGTIVGSMIASSTITKDKIVNVDLSQVNGYAALLTTSSTPTLADITATSSFAAGFTIAPLAVDTGKLADAAVTTVKIADSNVTFAKITGTGATAKTTLTSSDLFAVADAADSFKLKSVTVGNLNTALTTLVPNQVVQSLYYSYNTSQDQDTTVMATDTVAGLTTSQQKSGIGDCAITPKAATSKIRVRVTGHVRATNSNKFWIGVYDNTAATFIAWGRVYFSGAGTSSVQFVAEGLSAAVGSVAARNYSVYFGSDNAVANTCTVGYLAVPTVLTLEEISQ